MVAKFLDISVTRRMMNFRSNDYSTMQYAMFVLMKEVRGKSPADLAEILVANLAKENEVIGTCKDFYMHKSNRRQIHYILARITDYVERMSGLPSHYIEYTTGEGNKKFEVEHIWANHYEEHKEEFDHAADFDSYRNRFGGLLLLQKPFNASYGDLPYKKKWEHYPTQNLLAASLNPVSYDRNPGFLPWIKKNNLPFQPIQEFTKKDIDARGKLYFHIANKIWDPAIITEELWE